MYEIVNESRECIAGIPLVAIRSLEGPSINQITQIGDDIYTMYFSEICDMINIAFDAYEEDHLSPTYYIHYPLIKDGIAPHTILGVVGRLSTFQEIQPYKIERIPDSACVKNMGKNTETEVSAQPSNTLVFLGYTMDLEGKKHGFGLKHSLVDICIPLVEDFVLPLYKDGKLSSETLPVTINDVYTDFPLMGIDVDPDIQSAINEFALTTESERGNSFIGPIFTQDAYLVISRSNSNPVTTVYFDCTPSNIHDVKPKEKVMEEYPETPTRIGDQERDNMVIHLTNEEMKGMKQMLEEWERMKQEQMEEEYSDEIPEEDSELEEDECMHESENSDESPDESDDDAADIQLNFIKNTIGLMYSNISAMRNDINKINKHLGDISFRLGLLLIILGLGSFVSISILFAVAKLCITLT